MATSEHFSPHTSMNGCISDSALLSMQEVEERIHQLLTENATLRSMVVCSSLYDISLPCSCVLNFTDTLQQNNTYMRQLSVTLIEWQDEVVRVSIKKQTATDHVLVNITDHICYIGTEHLPKQIRKGKRAYPEGIYN